MKGKCLRETTSETGRGALQTSGPHPPSFSSQGILVAACLVCGRNGRHNPSGCRSTQSSFTPSHFLSSQMEQCALQSLDPSLTASQRWPQDCRSHLPVVAEPAEGWAARQAPGAHASCRLSGCWGGRGGALTRLP